MYSQLQVFVRFQGDDENLKESTEEYELKSIKRFDFMCWQKKASHLVEFKPFSHLTSNSVFLSNHIMKLHHEATETLLKNLIAHSIPFA